MRMMQHKLREEERDQMRSSCEKNSSVYPKTPSSGLQMHFHYISSLQ